MTEYYILRESEEIPFLITMRENYIPTKDPIRTIFCGEEVSIIGVSVPSVGATIVRNWINSFLEGLRKENWKKDYELAFAQLKPLFEEILSAKNSGQSWWRPPDWDTDDGYFACDMSSVGDFLNRLDEWLTDVVPAGHSNNSPRDEKEV